MRPSCTTAPTSTCRSCSLDRCGHLPAVRCGDFGPADTGGVIDASLPSLNCPHVDELCPRCSGPEHGTDTEPRISQQDRLGREAVRYIHPGDTVAVSGFASAGTPKAVTPALAERIRRARAAGEEFTVDLLTGASVSADVERLLAETDGIALRMPYQAEPTARARINDGRMDYVDIHLSHVAQQVWEGYYGTVDVAVVEVAGITESGELIPATSVGNSKTWLDVAEKIVLEVNSWIPEGLAGSHDIYYGTALPPHRTPILLTDVDDRIGQPFFRVDPERVVAWWRPTHPTVQSSWPRRIRPATPSPRRSWTSSVTRCGPVASPPTRSCPCNRASAMSPTQCWRGSPAVRTGD